MAFTAVPAFAQSPEQAAAQLGKSLNALTAKSAAVEGATVRLTGEAQLTSRLAVPAGVTLDLSADGARLALKGGARLTVDGTVNARGHGDQGKGWVDGGLCVWDGAALINGSGTIRLASKGCLLNISGRGRLTLDGVTLVGIADNNRSLVQVNNGGKFTLKSGAITGNTNTGGGGGVDIYKGTFTMESGEISGNTCDAHGAGVFVGERSTFTMTGGTISGNTSRNSAVSVQTGSTFTMKNGAITGNSNRGVHVWGKTAAFIMEGGNIFGNGCGQGRVDCGQGVAVHQGTFTMKGGAIYGNALSAREGGGVFVIEDGLFEMQGGRIQGGTDSDSFTRNVNNYRREFAALWLPMSRSKWGTGGAYTKGGVSQPGGSEIIGEDSDGTNETLIAIPGKKR